MKQITFTEVESNILIPLLSKRLVDNTIILSGRSFTKRKAWESFYVLPIQNALSKIRSGTPEIYSLKEKLTCISCINEHADVLMPKIDIDDDRTWLNVPSDLDEKFKLSDAACDILHKCSVTNRRNSIYYKVKHYRYRHTVSLVHKLKESTTIFLSSAGDNNFYKIGFADNNRCFSFGLYTSVPLMQEEFASLNGYSVEEYGRKKFSRVLTKTEAYSLLLKSNRERYGKGVWEFVEALLSS